MHLSILVVRETTESISQRISEHPILRTSSCSTNLLPPPTEILNPLNIPLLSPRPGSFRSLCLTSTLKASLSKNNFRSPSCWRVGCAAVLFSIRSNAARRDSTKLLSNRPTACFSGGGGTTTPGLFACKELYSHRKSLYLRVTANSG
jgi:hypothetical protein